MKKVQDTINTILQQIEKETDSVRHKSAQEIADILLNNTAHAGGNGGESAQNLAGSAEEDVHHMQSVQAVDLPVLDDELATANSMWNVEYYRPIYSHRKVTGKFIVFFKRAFRKVAKFLIEPIVLMQKGFNGSVVRALNTYRNGFVVISDQNAQLFNKISELNGIIDELKGKVGELEQAKGSRIQALESELNSRVQTLKGEQDDRIQALESELETEKSANTALCGRLDEISSELQRLCASDDTQSDIDYFRFENQFRGSREQIKQTLTPYLDYFRGSKRVYDLGSGRGELLELFTENGIGIIGVEMYPPFADYCNEHGLKTERSDALNYLKSLPDDHADGITAIQMIEHISASELVSLCKECYRVLDYGKALVFETPNPTCLSVYTNAFYIDPTHSNPVHPDYVAYLLREAGFSSVEIVYAENSRIPYRLPLCTCDMENLEAFNDGINCISDILFGCQNYAVVAVK